MGAVIKGLLIPTTPERDLNWNICSKLFHSGHKVSDFKGVPRALNTRPTPSEQIHTIISPNCQTNCSIYLSIDRITHPLLLYVFVVCWKQSNRRRLAPRTDFCSSLLPAGQFTAQENAWKLSRTGNCACSAHHSARGQKLKIVEVSVVFKFLTEGCEPTKLLIQ